LKFRYLTFDCYGTLIDWKTGITTSLGSAAGSSHVGGRTLMEAYVAAEKMEEETYQKYIEVLKRSALTAGRKLRVAISERQAEEFADSLPGWPAFPDTVRFLKEAGMQGYKRYILSNVDTDLLERTIENNGLEVDGFVTAEEVGSYKPREGQWLEFLEKTGAAKEQVLHVAQSVYHDIIPTQALGINSVWVNRYEERMTMDAQPLLVTDNLAHLTELLQMT
jgi:2-haloalkanoic acid dehalogenase type II